MTRILVMHCPVILATLKPTPKESWFNLKIISFTVNVMNKKLCFAVRDMHVKPAGVEVLTEENFNMYVKNLYES